MNIFLEKTDLFCFISPGISSHFEVGWTLVSSKGIGLWRLC